MASGSDDIPKWLLREYAKIHAYPIISILDQQYLFRTEASIFLEVIKHRCYSQATADQGYQQKPTPNFTDSFCFKTGGKFVLTGLVGPDVLTVIDVDNCNML